MLITSGQLGAHDEAVVLRAVRSLSHCLGDGGSSPEAADEPRAAESDDSPSARDADDGWGDVGGGGWTASGAERWASDGEAEPEDD